MIIYIENIKLTDGKLGPNVFFWAPKWSLPPPFFLVLGSLQGRPLARGSFVPPEILESSLATLKTLLFLAFDYQICWVPQRLL